MPIYIGSLGSGFINSFLAARRLRMQEEWYRTMREYYQSLMNKQGGAQTEFDKGAGTYKPSWDTGEGGGGGTVSGKFWTPDNQKHAYEYLMSTGRFSEYGAAGAVARMTREAPDGPTSENPKSHAFGIAQWLGDRLTPIKGNTNFDDQLKYYAGADLDRPEQARAKEQFKNASTAEEGSYAAMHMERAEGYQESGGRTDALLHSTPTDSVYATVHGKEGEPSVVTGKVSDEKPGRVEKVSAKPADIKAGWEKIINPKTPDEDKAAETYKKQNPDWMKQYNAGKPPVVPSTATVPKKPAQTPITTKGPPADQGVEQAQAQPFKPYDVAGPMQPPPTTDSGVQPTTGDVRSPAPQATVQPFDPYWKSNPPLSSLQKVQAADQPTTPAQGIPAPKPADTTQPAQPAAPKVPDEPRMKVQDQTQTAQRGIPPPPPPPSGGGDQAPKDTRLVLPDMPQNPPVAQTQDPFAGQTPQALPPGPTGQPLIRPQGTPQDQGQDQGPSQDDTADVLGSAKGGPVLKFARGGVIQKFQMGGQATPPAYSIAGQGISEGQQVRNQMNSLIPLSPTSTSGSISSAYNALTPQQQQWYTQAGQDISQVASLPLDVRATMGNMIYNQLGLPPAAAAAAATTPATAPATTPTATPAAAPATVTPATTAVNVPGGDTTAQGQPTTGLVPWATGQTGTITAPNTSSTDQTPFGQPSSGVTNYGFTNTQNPAGTSYDVSQYGYLTNTAGYQFGGDVSPAALGAPPGMPMGGQGQPPIPPVYYNPATFSPYGAGVGKGVSYASAPTLVAQGVPTYQFGGDVGGDQVDQDIAQQMRYTPTPDQSTTDSGGTEPIQPIQVASIDAGVHVPSLGGGGMGGMRGPMMRRPPLPRASSKSQDEGVHGYQDVPSAPQQPPPKPQGAPPEAPMITDGQGNPSNGVTSAIAGALHFLGNAMGIGPGQSNPAVATDPVVQANRRQFMTSDLTDEQHQGVLNLVDPDQALDNGMRNLAGLEAVYKYYMLNSNPDAANRTAASMLMYSRELASRFGDQAIAHYKQGDINSAIDALSKADDYIPNGLKLSGKLDPSTGQVDVEQRDLNNKLVWKQQVAPQAILAAALGVKNGRFFWGQLEQAAYKYDPVSQQMVDQKKIDQQAAALESAGRAMGGDAGGTGGPPPGEPGQGGAQPIHWKIPGQNAPVQANAASPQTPQPGPPLAANAPPTTGSGAGPAIPNAPTGQAIPPPQNVPPVVAQQNAQPVAPGASPADSGTAPSPDGSGQAVAQRPPATSADMPTPQAQDVSEEQEQSVYADIAAQAHSQNFTKDGVPLINGQPWQRPVEPSYAGMDKDTAARVKEMYKERLSDYNSAVKFATNNEREMISSANRDASADIAERRMRYRSEQSDLRQRQTMQQQEKLQTEREQFSQGQQTERQKFIEGQANQRVVLQSQLQEHNDNYKAQLKDTEPLTPENVNRGLTGNPDASPTDRYTAIVGMLASAADPTVQGGRPADAQTTLQNKGFQRDQQEFLARAFESAYTHSPHVDPRSVAQGIMSAANGEHTVFAPERTDKDGKPVAGPYGVRYAVTVDTPTGAISFTMPGKDFVQIKQLGEANATAWTQKTEAPVVTGSQFRPFRDTGIPSKPTPWQPPKPPPPQPTPARPLIQPSPSGQRPFAIPPRVYGGQIPKEWRDQFPELNQ